MACTVCSILPKNCFCLKCNEVQNYLILFDCVFVLFTKVYSFNNVLYTFFTTSFTFFDYFFYIFYYILILHNLLHDCLKSIDLSYVNYKTNKCKKSKIITSLRFKIVVNRC